MIAVDLAFCLVKALVSTEQVAAAQSVCCFGHAAGASHDASTAASHGSSDYTTAAACNQTLAKVAL